MAGGGVAAMTTVNNYRQILSKLWFIKDYASLITIHEFHSQSIEREPYNPLDFPLSTEEPL